MIRYAGALRPRAVVDERRPRRFQHKLLFMGHDIYDGLGHFDEHCRYSILMGGWWLKNRRRGLGHAYLGSTYGLWERG